MTKRPYRSRQGSVANITLVDKKSIALLHALMDKMQRAQKYPGAEITYKAAVQYALYETNLSFRGNSGNNDS